MYVQGHTHACTGSVHGKKLASVRGTTSRGVHMHKQGVHTEKGRYRHVDVRPEVYTHVHKAYTPKRGGTGTWMHVKRHTHT